MNTIADLLRLMSRETPRPIAFWRMTDGAEFWMMFPADDEIFDDRLSDNLRFPFRITEVQQLQIPSTAPGQDASCDLQMLYDKIGALRDVVARYDLESKCITVNFEPSENVG